MFFRRKGRLRADYDEQLVEQLKRLKKDWDHQSTLTKKSFDPFGEMELQTKIARAKYLILLREAKKRRISLLK
ncbi:YaaL family protein [Bacillus tuaregi]|uniref:YaaL family protein n=1 Tax=Bacillus tuaregi TaxID=1816695 RepID=UPI0008F84FDF|nr:YaaL family protein [Bacillus tuaregi]